MSESPILLLLLTVLLPTLTVVRWGCRLAEQPVVLGQLLLGVAMGNLGVWVGVPFFEILMHGESGAGLAEGAGVATATAFHALAEIGAVLLLFCAGLETSVSRLRSVGGSASAVAAIGVAAPFFLAYATCAWLHQDMPVVGHLFLAATLSATSIGVTASVLRDVRALDRRESEIILGGAVIDDVLGLLLLAIASRIATGGALDASLFVQTSASAALFVAVTLLAGEQLAVRGNRLLGKLDRDNGQECFALAFAFAAAWLAQSLELAAIVGAFAAGLVVQNDRFSGSGGVGPPKPSVSESIAPIERFLAPCFFLYLGMQVDLRLFLNHQVLLLAGVFTACAVVGKLASGVAARGGVDQLVVGVGMIPRGEVGLVFLATGRGLGVIEDEMFACLMLVVFLTTVGTPPALRWALQRQRRPTTNEPGDGDPNA